MKQAFALVAFLCGLVFVPCAALAHGFAGQRFFPATLATDDPFVADELSLPTFTSTRGNADDESPATRETSMSLQFARRITSTFGLELGATRLRIAPEGQPVAYGWDNVSIGAKYQLYVDEAREAIVSVGADWDVGATGSRSIGAERFSTITPTLFFGKGFGDVSVPALRPLALTGTLGVSIPTRASTAGESHPRFLNAGFALQYSLPYLQSHVKDVGLGEPFNHMIPLVEVTMSKPIDRIDDRRMTGTINPGVLWAGRKIQLGIEAVIPMNSRSGHGVGVIAQLHFFLDDVFPGMFGRPMFGDSK